MAKSRRFNAVRPAFHIRRRRWAPRRNALSSCFNAVRPAFHIRRSAPVLHSATGGDFVSMPCVRRFTFGGGQHNETDPDPNRKPVSMPCVRRFTFGVNRHICLKPLRLNSSFQCRASGVSHSEGCVERSFLRAKTCVSMPCVRRFTFGGYISKQRSKTLTPAPTPVL